MLAGCQGIQTPSAEKQSPENLLKKQNPGQPPGRFTTSILSLDLSKRPSKHSATQPTVTTPTPGRPAKKALQKRTTETADPHHPTTPLPSMDQLQDFKDCKSSPPARLRPSEPTSKENYKRTANHPPAPASPSNRTSKKNFKYCKPPRPPDCIPPDQLQKKNFRYFKPPLPDPRLHPSDFTPAKDREEICAAAPSLPRLENSQKALKGPQRLPQTSSKNLKQFGINNLPLFPRAREGRSQRIKSTLKAVETR